MSVSDLDVKAIYDGDDATVAFAINFDYDTDSTVKVLLREIATGEETVQTVDVDYTLSATQVTFDTAPSSDYKVVIYRESPLTQPDSFSVGAFPAVAVEGRFDKIIHALQELSEKLDRTIKLAIGSELSDLIFPEPVALSLLRWNATATGVENVDPLDIESLETDIDALDVRLTTAESSIGTNASAISTIQSDATTLAGRVTQNETDIDTLDGLVFDNGVDIGDLQASVALLSDQAAAIATLQTQMTTANSSIGTLEGQRAGYLSSIASNSARISALETIAYQLSRRVVGSMLITNNNSTATTVVGTATSSTLQINAAGAKSAEVYVEIERKTDDAHIFTSGRLIMHYIGTTWYVLRDTTTTINGVRASDDSPDGVTFSVATDAGVGTVKYVTDNMAGANYSGTLRWMLQEISSTF